MLENASQPSLYPAKPADLIGPEDKYSALRLSFSSDESSFSKGFDLPLYYCHPILNRNINAVIQSCCKKIWGDTWSVRNSFLSICIYKSSGPSAAEAELNSMQETDEFADFKQAFDTGANLPQSQASVVPGFEDTGPSANPPAAGSDKMAALKALIQDKNLYKFDSKEIDKEETVKQDNKDEVNNLIMLQMCAN